MKKDKPKQRPQGAYTNVQAIGDDLWIAQRGAQRKPTWYLYKLGRIWPQRSLNTTDRMVAIKLATQAWQAYQINPTGNFLGNVNVRVHNRDFKSVADEWLARETADLVNKEAVIRKYLIPYFQDVRKINSINDIDQAMVDDYKRWRLAFWTTAIGDAARLAEIGKSVRIATEQMASYCEAPSPNTLNREYPTLRQILKFGQARGYYTRLPLPIVKGEDAKANPRPAFLGDDFDRLMAEAEKWAKEPARAIDTVRRQLLCDWVWRRARTMLGSKRSWAPARRCSRPITRAAPSSKAGGIWKARACSGVFGTLTSRWV